MGHPVMRKIKTLWPILRADYERLRPQGAKARLLCVFVARLKPCPSREAVPFPKPCPSRTRVPPSVWLYKLDASE